MRHLPHTDNRAGDLLELFSPLLRLQARGCVKGELLDLLFLYPAATVVRQQETVVMIRTLPPPREVEGGLESLQRTLRQKGPAHSCCQARRSSTAVWSRIAIALSFICKRPSKTRDLNAEKVMAHEETRQRLELEKAVALTVIKWQYSKPKRG